MAARCPHDWIVPEVGAKRIVCGACGHSLHLAVDIPEKHRERFMRIHKRNHGKRKHSEAFRFRMMEVFDAADRALTFDDFRYYRGGPNA